MTTQPAKWQNTLAKLGACEEARKWAEGFATFEEAWEACEERRWMTWALFRFTDSVTSDWKREETIIDEVWKTITAFHKSIHDRIHTNSAACARIRELLPAAEAGRIFGELATACAEKGEVAK